MKKASIVVWNNLNIILCCICGFMAMYMNDWHCVGGWLCAALAWMQNNCIRFCIDRWDSESKKAINDLYRVSEGTNDSEIKADIHDVHEGKDGERF